MWQVNILSHFPEIYPGALGLSVTGRGLKEGIWSMHAHQIRDYAIDKHGTIDDAPYGGGSGMLLRPDVLADAIDDVFVPNGMPIIYLSPRGEVFNQRIATELASLEGINIICGRFEGIDERVFLEYKVRELSLGDFVLSAGDLAALPVIDACVRLLPGVMEAGEALKEESFGLDGEYENLLEYPHYTRPPVWRNHQVPDVLLSGHHANIAKWRIEQAKLKTKLVRPDLMDQCNKGDKNEPTSNI